MLGVKNRFAALKVEDDDDEGSASKGAQSNQNQSNSAAKKKTKKKKKESDEVKLHFFFPVEQSLSRFCCTTVTESVTVWQTKQCRSFCFLNAILINIKLTATPFPFH